MIMIKCDSYSKSIFSYFFASSNQLNNIMQLKNTDSIIKIKNPQKYNDIFKIFYEFLYSIFGYEIEDYNDIIKKVDNIQSLRRKDIVLLYYLLINKQKKVIELKYFLDIMENIPIYNRNNGNIMICRKCGLIVNIKKIVEDRDESVFLEKILKLHNYINRTEKNQCKFVDSEKVEIDFYVPLIEKANNRKIISDLSTLKKNFNIRSEPLSFGQQVEYFFDRKFKEIIEKFNLDNNDCEFGKQIIRNFWIIYPNMKYQNPQYMAIIFLFFIINEKHKMDGKNLRIKRPFSSMMRISFTELYKLIDDYYEKILFVRGEEKKKWDTIARIP